METFKVKCLSTNKVQEWSLEEVLYAINLGHSDQWTLYTADDWKEGWTNWVEGCGMYSMEISMTEENTRFRILLEDEKYSLDLRTYDNREEAEHHAQLYAQITGGKTSVFQEVITGRSK